MNAMADDDDPKSRSESHDFLTVFEDVAIPLDGKLGRLAATRADRPQMSRVAEVSKLIDALDAGAGYFADLSAVPPQKRQAVVSAIHALIQDAAGGDISKAG